MQRMQSCGLLCSKKKTMPIDMTISDFKGCF